MHPGLAASVGRIGGDFVRSMMVLEVQVTMRRSEFLKRPAICKEVGLVGTRMGREGVGGFFLHPLKEIGWKNNFFLFMNQ